MTKIELREPVEVCGAKVSALTLRRPKVRDVLAVAKATTSTQEQEVRLVALLCDVEPAAIEALDWEDYRKIQAAASGFFD